MCGGGGWGGGGGADCFIVAAAVFVKVCGYFCINSSIFDIFLVAPMKLFEASQLVSQYALHKFSTLHAS